MPEMHLKMLLWAGLYPEQLQGSQSYRVMGNTQEEAPPFFFNIMALGNISVRNNTEMTSFSPFKRPNILTQARK